MFRDDALARRIVVFSRNQSDIGASVHYGHERSVFMSIHLIETLLLIGSLVAACAVAAVCGLGLVVWLAGAPPDSRAK